MKINHDVSLYRETLRNVFLQYGELDKEIMHEFIDLFQPEIYPKNATIIAPNSTNHKLYFIASGLVRIYYEVGGKEITSDFKEEGTFFTNGYTLFTKLPNIDYHTALENTVCMAANYNYIEQLCKSFHTIEHLGRKMVEKYYTTFLKINYNKLFLSAEERYEVFTRERAALLNRLPLRHVASYLGIAPETLSRLRAKYQAVHI